jgi:hypothetical protein
LDSEAQSRELSKNHPCIFHLSKFPSNTSYLYYFLKTN